MKSNKNHVSVVTSPFRAASLAPRAMLFLCIHPLTTIRVRLNRTSPQAYARNVSCVALQLAVAT